MTDTELEAAWDNAEVRAAWDRDLCAANLRAEDKEAVEAAAIQPYREALHFLMQYEPMIREGLGPDSQKKLDRLLARAALHPKEA